MFIFQSKLSINFIKTDFIYLYLLFCYQLQYFSSYIFRAFTKVIGDFYVEKYDD